MTDRTSQDALAGVFLRILHSATAADVMNCAAMKPDPDRLPSSLGGTDGRASPSTGARIGIEIFRPLLWLGIFASALVFWFVVGSLLFRLLVSAG